MRKDIKVGVAIAGFVAVGLLAMAGGNMQDSQKADASATKAPIVVADHAFMKRCEAALAPKKLNIKSRRPEADICACITPKVAAVTRDADISAASDILEGVFMTSRLRSSAVGDDVVRARIVEVKTEYRLSNAQLNDMMGTINTSLNACAVEERVVIDKPKPRPVAAPRPQPRQPTGRTQSTSNNASNREAMERAAQEEANIGRPQATRRD